MIILRGRSTPAVNSGVAAHTVAVAYTWPEARSLILITNNTGGTMWVRMGGTAILPAALTAYDLRIPHGGERFLTIRTNTLSIYFNDDGGVGTVYVYGTNFTVNGWSEGAPTV